jgi:glycosyltransferase involved in cell wall biosynthesis
VRKGLVYVLNSYSPDDASHFHHVLPLIEAIADRGVHVRVVIEKAQCLPMFSSPNVHVSALSTTVPLLRHVELILAIRRHIRDGCSAVFTRIAIPAGVAAAVACFGTKASSFYWQSGTVHALDREAAWSIAKLRWWLTTHLPFRVLLRLVDFFATGPETMVGYYRDQVGVPPGKLVLLYNDVSVGRFAPTGDGGAERRRRRADLGATDGDTVLLFVHRMSPVRRSSFYMPHVVDQAANGVSTRVICVLVGDGPELPYIKECTVASRSGVRYVFLGSVPNRRIQDLYLAADIFIHPSYNEGFPRVMLEAMAAGLPIVSTDAGGARDIVGPLQSRFIVPRDDRDAFAEKLGLLIHDAAGREALVSESRQWVVRFDTLKVAEMYERVLLP